MYHDPPGVAGPHGVTKAKARKTRLGNTSPLRIVGGRPTHDGFDLGESHPGLYPPNCIQVDIRLPLTRCGHHEPGDPKSRHADREKATNQPDGSPSHRNLAFFATS